MQRDRALSKAAFRVVGTPMTYAHTLMTRTHSVETIRSDKTHNTHRQSGSQSRVPGCWDTNDTRTHTLMTRTHSTPNGKDRQDVETER